MSRETPERSGGLRVGVNATGGHGWTGGAYYMQNAARAFGLRGHQVTWLLERGAAGSLAPAEASTVPFARPSVTTRRLLRLLEGRQTHRRPQLEWAALAEGIDVLAPVTVAMGRRCAVPWVGWIPDLQHVDLPHFFSPQERADRDAEYRAMRDEAPVLLFSSEHAKTRFVETLGARDRLFVARFPAVPDDSWYEGPWQAVLSQYGIDEPYVYLPNQFWVHKNHATVIDAWERLGSRAPLLVCTGALEDYRAPGHAESLLARIRSSPVANRIRVLGLVDRVHQLALYRCSAVVLNPSLYEGWSTTVEEARAFGRPVVLSDIPLFREQMGNHAEYFDPSRADALSACMERRMPEFTRAPDVEAERRARQDSVARLQAYADVWDAALRAACDVHRPSRRGSLARAAARALR